MMRRAACGTAGTLQLFFPGVTRMLIGRLEEEEMRNGFASALLAIFVLAGAATMLGACNTTRGFGEDMSAAGNALSNSAEKTKDAM
jgi:predicted small secreted protein